MELKIEFDKIKINSPDPIAEFKIIEGEKKKTLYCQLTIEVLQDDYHIQGDATKIKEIFKSKIEELVKEKDNDLFDEKYKLITFMSGGRRIYYSDYPMPI